MQPAKRRRLGEADDESVAEFLLTNWHLVSGTRNPESETLNPQPSTLKISNQVAETVNGPDTLPAAGIEVEPNPQTSSSLLLSILELSDEKVL